MKQLIRHILREHTREIGEASTKKLTQDEFIKRSKEKHDNKYDYSKVEYVNTTTPVKIICPVHGEFEQIPKSHLIGKGCDKCGGSGKSNTSEFVEKAKKINPDYDYSKVRYETSRTPVKIKCPIHGWFEQTPNRFLNGALCQKCGIEKRTASHRYDSEKFIELAKKIHGDKYDYTKVNYVNSKTPVEVICKKHDTSFSVNPTHHIVSKSGCPICRESKGEILVVEILKKYKINFDRFHEFDDCTNKIKGRYCRKLSYDFYLPKNNVCIEYDGEQHYKSFGTDTGEKLMRTQKNDKLKNQYCKKNGIKLIRIPYTMKKEEIEPYILKELGIK